MSVEALSAVINHSRADGLPWAVLVVIANHDGEGGAWPSIATLCERTKRDVRGVQRAIKTLVELGELRVTVQAGGLASTPDRFRTNRYDVLIRCPENCDGTTNHRLVRGRARPAVHSGVVPAPGVQNGEPGVVHTPGGGVVPAPPEPSLEPSFGVSDETHWPAWPRAASQRADETKIKKPRRRASAEARQASWLKFQSMDLGDIDDDHDTRAAAFLQLEGDHRALDPAAFAEALIDRGEWDGFCATHGIGAPAA